MISGSVEAMDEPYDQSGLMRCCIATLQEHFIDSKPSQEGQVMDCRFEKPGNRSLIFSNGAWRWNREEKLGSLVNDQADPGASDS